MENKKHVLLTGVDTSVLASVPYPNVQPIEDTSDFQRQWNIDDLYTAGLTPGRYIARVGDIVNDYQTGSYWVTAVDKFGIASMIKWPFADSGDETIGAIDEFIGRYRTQATYGIYIDSSTYPYRLVVDSSYFIGGSTIKYCKVFLNDDVTEETGNCISQWLENNVKVSDSFPLEIVATDKLDNSSLKVVQPGWTNYKVRAGDLVSVVFYGDDTNSYKVVPMRVYESSVVRDSALGTDRIIGVSIESPWIDPKDPDVIRVPMNTTLDTIDMRGVVHYESGDTNKLGIDGTKFSLLGADLFMAVQPGFSDDLVLRYALGEKEQSIAAVHGYEPAVVKEYRIVVASKINQYDVCLFVVPTWNSTYARYELRYFMYSMERTFAMDVTEHVFNAGVESPNFDGNQYSAVQELYVGINLQDVFPDYPAHRHVQNFAITLNGPYHLTPIPFTLDYDSGHDRYFGGEGVAEMHLEAVTPYVYMGKGFRYEWEFLDALYYTLKPMYDLELEQVAPVPTHFRLRTHNNEVLGTFRVSDWNKSLTVGVEFSERNTLQLDWIIINNETEIQLATVGIRVTQVGVPSTPLVTVQPESDVYGNIGESYTLTFEVEGQGNLTIQWHWTNHDGTENGTDHGDTTNRIVKTIHDANAEGRRWFAEITNEAGVKVTTRVATVHVLA